MYELPYVRQPLELPVRYAYDLNRDEPVLNWFSTSLRLAAALAEQGYDLRLVVGDGAHSAAPGNHGAAILPDALRWVWAPRPD